MNSNQILGICLPTCYPEESFNNIFSDESLKNLKPLSKVMTFLINFQPPWTKDLINQVLIKIKDYGFEVDHTFNQYDYIDTRHIPINKIRNECAELKDCAFYSLIDDDFIFENYNKKSGGQSYLEGLHYMTFHENCGILSFRKDRMKEGDQPLKPDHISITPIHSYYATWLGVFLRSMKNITNDGNFFPNYALNLLGGGEEKLLAAYRLYHGLYPARSSNSLVFHKAIESDGGKRELGWWDLDILDEYANKFIKDNYNSEFEMGYSYNLIKPEDYESKGGILYNEITSKELEVDYTKSNCKELEKEIIEYWRDK